MGWVAVCLGGGTLQYRLEDSGRVLPWSTTVQRHSSGGSTGHALLAPSCADRRNLFFLWAYSTQTVHPPSKLTRKRHILGMSTSPRNDSHCPKLCRLSCSLITNIPYKIPILAVFGTCKIPYAEIRKFFTGVRMRIPIHFLFQKRSQSVQDKWSKVRVVLVTKNETKHLLAFLGQPFRRFPPNFFVLVRTVTRHLYSESHLDPFKLGKDITENPLQEPPEWINCIELS